MMGTMANDEDQRKVVRGHGLNGKQHEVKLEVLEDLTIVADVGWLSLPQPWSYTLCSQYVK
jgi:hypothetical protein